MKILIDTNVVFDYLTAREPFAENSTKIMQLCMEKKISGYIAVHTVLNLFYTLRKDIPNVDTRRDVLLNLCKFVDVIEIDTAMLMKSLENREFKDFEDCVQAECAIKANADYIVTRNIKDFEKSPVKAILPEDLLKEM